MNSTDAVRHLIAALESLGAPYVLVGALASNVYSIGRSKKTRTSLTRGEKVTCCG